MEYVETNRFGPSYEEIREHLGMKSLTRARACLADLVELGVIEMSRGNPRTIRVVPLT